MENSDTTGNSFTEQFTRGVLTKDAFLQVYYVSVHQLHSFSTNSIDPQPTDELEAHSLTPPRGVLDNFMGQKLEGDPLVCCKLHVIK